MIKIALCTVIFIVSFPVYSAELGRLFISESERSMIDEMRKKELYEDRVQIKALEYGKKKKRGDLVKGGPEKVTQPENSLVTMNGFIRRENGGVTVWVNGIMGGEGGAKNIHIQKSLDEKNRVILRSKKNIKRLKVGQKWNYKTDEVYDSY